MQRGYMSLLHTGSSDLCSRLLILMSSSALPADAPGGLSAGDEGRRLMV